MIILAGPSRSDAASIRALVEARRREAAVMQQARRGLDRARSGVEQATTDLASVASQAGEVKAGEEKFSDVIESEREKTSDQSEAASGPRR